MGYIERKKELVALLNYVLAVVWMCYSRCHDQLSVFVVQLTCFFIIKLVSG